MSCSGFGKIDFRLTLNKNFVIFGSSGRTKKIDECEIFLDNIKTLREGKISRGNNRWKFVLEKSYNLY